MIGSRRLPPGPRTPPALQTVEWIARPTTLLRREAARHGEPFTLRTHWTDGPLVLVWSPEEVRRLFAAGADELRGGSSSAILEPFAGPSSILLLHGPEHLRQRRLMLPPFHGAALEVHRATVARLAARELDAWRSDRLIATHGRMRALTLDVIIEVTFGGPRPELRQAIAEALQIVSSMPRLVAMALGRGHGPFLRAVERVDRLLADEIARPGGGILELLLEARDEDGRPATPRELRDQLVTLLAAGHETTATSLAWALERLARHPQELARLRADPGYADPVVKEVLRVRPVLSIAPRQVVSTYEAAGHELPAGTHVAACMYLTHRRADLYPEPAAFKPERWVGAGAPESFAWIPFGGGMRRCLGASFATMEMTEVLTALAARFTLDPEREEGERMRRMGVTLAPARGARVVPRPL